MPKLTHLLTIPHANNRAHLEELVSVLYARDLITRSQWHVICVAAAPALPASVTIHQRTPKSVTYVRAGDTSFRVNVRAKLFRENP